MEEPGQIGMAEASRVGEPGSHEVIVNSTLKEGSCTWKIRYGNWELI